LRTVEIVRDFESYYC